MQTALLIVRFSVAATGPGVAPGVTPLLDREANAVINIRKINLSDQFDAKFAWMIYPGPMDVSLLQSLIRVAERGAITEAAQSLGITQPTLTRRIQQLEQELDAQLLERSRKGVVLTEVGRVVVREGRAWVERWAELKLRVQALQRLEQGTVRVGGGATAVSFVLPDAIAAFTRDHPGMRFEVREAGSRDIERDVAADRLDLGIVTMPVQSREFDVVPLRSDRIVLVAAADHPLARRSVVPVSALEGQSLVGFEVGSAIRRLIDAQLQGAGVEMNVVMELRSIPAILQMVRSSASLAFVSRIGVQDDDPRVRVLRVRGLKITRQLAVVSRRGRPLSAAARAFAGRLQP
jgi:DNA-binding transcriptional LysR family regulator